MKIRRIALIGGSGFVGRHLSRHLRNRGYQCRIITRHAHRHSDLRTSAELAEADPFDETRLTEVLRGCDAAVNLVGILNSGGPSRCFRRVHVELIEHLITACQAGGVRRLLHMSALNADQAGGASEYLRTKGEGENLAHTRGKPGIAVTSFRPSVIFGPDDSFLNRFAALLRLPVPLPLACPDARFAPIYVGDLVEAFAKALEDPTTYGKHYQLCGPRSYRLRDIVRFVADHTVGRKLIIPMPDALSRMQAQILQYMPGKPFTPDNYQSMRLPSTCSADDLRALGVTPTSLEAMGPRCLNGDDINRRRHLARQYSGR